MSNDSSDEAWQKRIEELKAMGIKFAEKKPYAEFKNTENTFSFKYGYLQKREEKYWFRFGGSGHGGPDIIIEITEQEYLDGRSGTLDIELFLAKYREKSGDYERSVVIRQRWIEKGIYYEQ